MLNLEKITGLVVAFALTTVTLVAQDLHRVYRERPALGTKISVTCYASDTLQVIGAIARAFDLVDSLNLIFSDYDPASEVMQLAANRQARQGVKVSKPLYDLTARALEITELTGGSFNVAIGALTHLWRTFLAGNKIPPRCRIRRYRRHLASGNLQLVEPSSLILKKKGMRLDFGGIAKGYIGDEMAKVLREEQIDRYLIDLGGDLVAGSAPPGQDGWNISIAWCRRVILVENRAIATSGPDFQFFVHKGQRYAHLIDPETGWGVSSFFGTTVIAKNGWQADALASAFSIMTLEESAEVLRRKTDIAALIGRDNELFQSDNFSSYGESENQNK